MTRIKNGTDLVQISRIDQMCRKWGDHFLKHIYTDNEILYCQKKKNAVASYAGRFAAKEAVAKALGSGIGPHGVSFIDIEVYAVSAAPHICLHGKTKTYFKAQGGKSITISISHDGDYALAFCMIEFEEDMDETIQSPD